MLYILFLGCLSAAINAQLINISLSDVLINQALWQSSRISDYNMTFRWVGNYGSCGTLWKFVEVRNANVTQVSYNNSKKAVNNSCGSHLEMEDFVSVDDMFDTLISSVPTAEASSAIFDPIVGYPSFVFIDVMAMLADDEISWLIGALSCVYNSNILLYLC